MNTYIHIKPLPQRTRALDEHKILRVNPQAGSREGGLVISGIWGPLLINCHNMILRWKFDLSNISPAKLLPPWKIKNSEHIIGTSFLLLPSKIFCSLATSWIAYLVHSAMTEVWICKLSLLQPSVLMVQLRAQTLWKTRCHSMRFVARVRDYRQTIIAWLSWALNHMQH